MKNLSLVLTLVFVFATVSAFATTYTWFEDFDSYADGATVVAGWYLSGTSCHVSNAQSVSPNNSLVSGGSSASYTTQVGDPPVDLYSDKGTYMVDFYPVGGSRIELGWYDENGLVLQTQISSAYVREYVAGGYEINMNSGIVGDQWNHIEVEFDYIAGYETLSINYVPFWTRAFGLGNGETGTGVKSYVHARANADWYIDNVGVIPEPASIGLLGLLGLFLRRKK